MRPILERETYFGILRRRERSRTDKMWKKREYLLLLVAILSCMGFGFLLSFVEIILTW